MIATTLSQHPSTNIDCAIPIRDPSSSHSPHHSSISYDCMLSHPTYIRAASALHHSALLWPTHASHESLHYVLPITHHLIQHACLSVYIHYVFEYTTRLSDLYWSMCYALLMIVLSSALHPVCHNNHTNSLLHTAYSVCILSPVVHHSMLTSDIPLC